MDSNAELIDHLIATGALRSPELIRAFERCDRIDFVPDGWREDAYADAPLPIGHLQTISQPFTVAFMLELLSPRKGERILDIGSGSGWTTALLAAAVGETGRIEGIERIGELVDYGRANLQKSGITNASIRLSDPDALGIPGSLYDRILVSAAADTFPTSLYGQLKPGGRLVVPVRQSIWSLEKEPSGNVRGTEYPGFRFVPLIDPVRHFSPSET